MNKRIIRKILLWLIPAAVIGVFLFRDRLIDLVRSQGSCVFWLITGHYCPGCGNTRSAYHMLHFRVFSAIRCNPAVPFVCLCGVLAYLELLADGNVRLLPRKGTTWLFIGVLFCGFYVLRNFWDILAPISP